MRRKIWIKRRRNSVKLDWRKTVRMWTINIIAVVVVALLWVSLAYAQPELKVGQEVELMRNYWAGCAGKIVKITDTSIVVVEKVDDSVRPERKWEYCVQSFQTITDYRILKPTLAPAPRPEFKLPSENYSPKECVYAHVLEKSIPPGCRTYDENDQAIADELRYLREEIEGLK